MAAVLLLGRRQTYTAISRPLIIVEYAIHLSDVRRCTAPSLPSTKTTTQLPGAAGRRPWTDGDSHAGSVETSNLQRLKLTQRRSPALALRQTDAERPEKNQPEADESGAILGGSEPS